MKIEFVFKKSIKKKERTPFLFIVYSDDDSITAQEK